MKRVLFGGILLSFTFSFFIPPVLAQQDFCRPVPVSIDSKNTILKSASGCTLSSDCDLVEIRDVYIPDSTTPIKYVQIYFHILAEDNTSGQIVPVSSIDSAINGLNTIYAPYKLQFEYKYDICYASAFRTIDPYTENFDMKIAYAVEHLNYFNTYVTNVNVTGIGVFSWAELPFNPQGILKINGAVMHYEHVPPKTDATIIAHEFGHGLGGLLHISHGVSEVEPCSECYETPRNFDTDYVGDFCSDTPPNPKNFNCVASPDIDPCSRLPWAPNNSQRNIMSYGCKEFLTRQQLGRFHCHLESFYPDMFHYIRGIPDTTIGKGQLDVNFQGYSEFDAAQWIWVFDDTDSSFTQNPTHNCTQPGYNQYSLTVVTTTGDTLTREYKNEILIVGDTISIGSTVSTPGEQVIVPVYLQNFVPVDHISLAFVLDGDDIEFDSFTTIDHVGEDFYSSILKSYDGFNNRFSINLTNYEFDTQHQLQPGLYQLINLHFTTKQTALNGATVTIAPESYNTYANICNTNTIVYEPYTKAGTVTINCCKNIRGNIDYDTGDVIDISDLLYFVDFLFSVPSGDAPPCESEADVNASGDLDVSDLLYIVDYFFAIPAGPAPMPCDEK